VTVYIAWTTPDFVVVIPMMLITSRFHILVRILGKEILMFNLADPVPMDLQMVTKALKKRV